VIAPVDRGPSRLLQGLLAATDLAFIGYWAASALDALGWLRLPTAWLYAHHDDPRVVAWNWSFLPLDLAFSLTGLLAVRAGRRGDPAWRGLAVVSLCLTMTAGGMACGYWLLTQEIDPAWFGANLLLLVWPAPFLLRLLRGESGLRRA
jgi:hypothetical protein